jgi:hypothetical protein
MSQGGFKGASVSHARRETQMRAYDQLPPSVRAALQQAVFDWAPYPIRRRFEAGRVTAKELVRQVRQWDRDALKKRK